MGDRHKRRGPMSNFKTIDTGREIAQFVGTGFKLK